MTKIPDGEPSGTVESGGDGLALDKDVRGGYLFPQKRQDMAVVVSGMFGNNKTYFSDSPVVIDISGLEWADSSGTVASPFTIVRVEVIYDGKVVGDFHADTGGQTSISFDISSALRAIWSGYDYDGNEVVAAQGATQAGNTVTRAYRSYSLAIYTEYLDSQDGEFVRTSSGTISGGRCLPGGMTELERSMITEKANADVSALEHTGVRNGDASTKPTSSPERIGRDSITSWVDVWINSTRSTFYAATATPAADDDPASGQGWGGHAPIVLRDSIPYVDFLFLNRRGAIETCSGQTLESMGIDVETTQYNRVERPAFQASRSLASIGSGGRRSWQMSSGYVTREWAEWWTQEFLAPRKGRRHWMRYPVGDPAGTYVPVIVEPAKKQTDIYDRAKQQLPHVDFTVTMALEG